VTGTVSKPADARPSQNLCVRQHGSELVSVDDGQSKVCDGYFASLQVGVHTIRQESENLGGRRWGVRTPSGPMVACGPQKTRPTGLKWLGGTAMA